jgi:hypothetical protein
VPGPSTTKRHFYQTKEAVTNDDNLNETDQIPVA